MKKRKNGRVASNLEVFFTYKYISYSGRIINLSKSGMCVMAESPLPFSSRLQMMFLPRLKLVITIPGEPETFEVPVKVRRLVKKDGHCNGIGVELARTSQDYLEFLSNFRYIYQAGIS